MCPFVFLACCSPPAKGFLSRFRLRGEHGVRRYITTHDWIPAELRGACSEHSKPRSWILCRGGAFHLAEPNRRMEKPVMFTVVIFHCPLRSFIFLIRSSLPPAIFSLSAVYYDAATNSQRRQQQQQQHFFVAAMDGASGCVHMCAPQFICEWSVRVFFCSSLQRVFFALFLSPSPSLVVTQIRGH